MSIDRGGEGSAFAVDGVDIDRLVRSGDLTSSAFRVRSEECVEMSSYNRRTNM